MSQPSPEVTLLVQWLRDCHQNNQIATYTDMKDLVHNDIQKKKRHYLHSALAIVLRDYGYVFQTIPNVGCAPVKTKDVAKLAGEKWRAEVHSSTKRGREKINAIDSPGLSPLEVCEVQARYAQMAMVDHLVSAEATKKLDQESKRQVGFKGLDHAKEAFRMLAGLI